MMAKMSRHALRFEKAGLRDWIAWVRRGAYLLTDLTDGTWRVSYMPQMSAKHPKPVFASLGPPLATQHDALIFAQSHEDAARTAKKK